VLYSCREWAFQSQPALAWTAATEARHQRSSVSPQAEALIRARLQETPDEARLWCALGDLRQDDGCYRAAWERSGHRSARAKRSLARR
jgi:hypothetical protein